MAEKVSEKKTKQWSTRRRNPAEARQQQYKNLLLTELAEEFARAGFHRTTQQITNKLRKLKRDYKDAKKDLNKSGN